jgi:hypothetical protein
VGERRRRGPCESLGRGHGSAGPSVNRPWARNGWPPGEAMTRARTASARAQPAYGGEGDGAPGTWSRWPRAWLLDVATPAMAARLLVAPRHGRLGRLGHAGRKRSGARWLRHGAGRALGVVPCWSAGGRPPLVGPSVAVARARSGRPPPLLARSSKGSLAAAGRSLVGDGG